MDLGVILAEAQITFRAPILFGAGVRVGACVTRLGNKSMSMAYCIEDSSDGREYATASSVLVTYDYHSGETIPIPALWREKIRAFEGLE